jgi:phosphorylcholine metabolism protein LicD/GT2 family glycosyltransferase
MPFRKPTKALSILTSFISILSKYKLHYFLDGGTLLGAIRNNNFIDKDGDMDIGIFNSEWELVKENVIAHLIKAGFTIDRRNSQCFAVKKGGYHIDGWKFIERDTDYFHYGWAGEFSFCKDTLDTLDKVVFMNREFTTPHNPKKYLKHLYGEDWQTPKSMNKPYDYPNYSDKSTSMRVFLKQVIDLLNQNEIRYTLLCGSLLGAYRDKNIIEGDDDFDLGLFAEDYEKVRQLLSDNNIAIKALWRREISILSTPPIPKCQIDLFFLEKEGSNLYLYSQKPNPLSKKWNLEWRRQFPAKYFKEFVPIDFIGLEVMIPKDTEKILEHHYGNWKVKDSNANGNLWKPDSIDHNYREIAIVSTNFLRNETTKTFIESIQQILPKEWYRIYLVDQGPYDAEMELYYAKLRLEGHVIQWLPYNCGLSFARNHLIKQSKEPYIYLMDNDFILTPESDPSPMLTILENDPNIGIVGAKLIKHEDYHFNLIWAQNPRKLYYVPTLPTSIRQTKAYKCQKAISYRLCDIVLNFALYKREVFKDFQWDEELLLVEHSDAFLRLKEMNKWLVAYTSDVLAIHTKDRKDGTYRKFRGTLNAEKCEQLFLKKWKLDKQDIIKIRGV